MAKPDGDPDKGIKDKIKSKKNPYKDIEWITPGRGYEVRYKGTFNYDQFYNLMHRTLTENDYEGLYGGDDNSLETHYEDRNMKGFREVWHRWRTTKEFTPYCDFFMLIDTQLIGLSEKEIIHKEQKLKMHALEVGFAIRAGFKLKVPFDKVGDLLKQWTGPDGQKFMGRYYGDELDIVAGVCYDDALTVLDTLKQFLGLPVSEERNMSFFYTERRGLPMIDTAAPDFTPNTDD